MSEGAWKNYALAGGADGAADLRNDSFEDRIERQWFSCAVPRKELKRLMKRSDAVALRHFALWLGLLAISGAIAFVTWGTPWCIPAFAAYGILYAAADHRHHELSHGTPSRPAGSTTLPSTSAPL